MLLLVASPMYTDRKHLPPCRDAKLALTAKQRQSFSVGSSLPPPVMRFLLRRSGSGRESAVREGEEECCACGRTGISIDRHQSPRLVSPWHLAVGRRAGIMLPGWLSAAWIRRQLIMIMMFSFGAGLAVTVTVSHIAMQRHQAEQPRAEAHSESLAVPSVTVTFVIPVTPARLGDATGLRR